VSASVIVWDQKTDPPDTVGQVLCWQSYAQGAGVVSVPRYLEDHADRLRAKYLAFVYDLGQSRIHGKSLAVHLDRGEGFSFWWMTQLAEKSPFKSSRLHHCLRLIALEEILLKKKPAELSLVSSDRDLAQATRELCRKLQISFVWRPQKPSRRDVSLRRVYLGLPHPVRGLFSLAKLLITRWPLRKGRAPSWFSGDGAVFLCSYFMHLDPVSCAEGHFVSHYWGVLLRHLHNNGRRTNWVHHFVLSPAVPDTRTGLDWLQLFNGDARNQGYHTFLSSYLTLSVVVRALKDWIRLNVVAWRLRNIQTAFYPKGSVVWLWPVLRRDWQTSLNGSIAIVNCLWRALFDAALNDIPRQRVGFYLCENQGWERALLWAWRKHGHGKIIGVPHSTVPFWHMYYFDDPRSLNAQQSCAMPLPDHLAVNGSVAWTAFAGAGYPVERLVEVEALRYLNLYRVTPQPDLDSEACRVTKRPMSKTSVLILGDMIPESMHNLLNLLKDAMQLLPTGYKFTLKPHPGYEVHLVDYPGLQADQTIEALDQILRQYDLVVAANSTSAAVDAYQVGLPVIIMLDGNQLNLSPLRGYPHVRFVNTPEELAEALQSADRSVVVDAEEDNMFFLDPELPRWNRLLSAT
jgi:surface carbohydrate biosynthesis protein (TIGR04326 family)